MKRFSTQRARAVLESYRQDFASDDALHEEQAEIAGALSSPTWPKTRLDYRHFCLRVLGHGEKQKP